MSEQEYYYTIDKPASAEFRDKGSKFIAYVFPLTVVADFKKQMEEIKKEHPKATHYCFGYRIGLDGNSFRVSDDGEPSGTAGKPILGQIDSKQVTDRNHCGEIFWRHIIGNWGIDQCLQNSDGAGIANHAYNSKSH